MRKREERRLEKRIKVMRGMGGEYEKEGRGQNK